MSTNLSCNMLNWFCLRYVSITQCLLLSITCVCYLSFAQEIARIYWFVWMSIPTENKSFIVFTVGHLFSCLYCTTAYHGHERCLPAGSFSIVNSSSLCCPVHIPAEKIANRPALAPNCYFCERTVRNTETLVCVECPAIAHQSCLSSKEDEEKPKTWKCDVCSSNIKPLYGDIVWIKMGKYR